MVTQRGLWFALSCWLVTFAGPATAVAQEANPKRKLPNIIWITSEDHGPHLGCYGDKLARTPNLDKLARKGMRYRMCWSNAPVCAPARTTIISGLYATSTGAEHMRSLVSLPREFQMFPALLRALGYYCTNRVKEDYNLRKDGKVWDDSSNKAHWKNRPAGTPFFAVFNSLKSHESQLRGYKTLITDPAKVRVPAYHPDVPEVRSDWARYYDIVALVDADAAALIRELDEAGLLEDTIIFYFADHGSGMPRSKRTPLNSGLQVPLIVYFPDNWIHLAPPEYRPGGVSDRLVSFVDLAPTMLSLAGEPAPKWMQGRAFAGKHVQAAPEFLHGFRGRMDERYDLQRSVTDGRYVYLRNFMPHLPAGQHVDYMFQTKTTDVWKKMFDLGKLNDVQSQFWKAPRPPEELYDLQNDPDEVKNLARSVGHREILVKLRKAQRDHVLAIRDVGFLPEDEIHVRSVKSTPFEKCHDRRGYPLESILSMAEAASAWDKELPHNLDDALTKGDPAISYWAALGVLARGPKTIQDNLPALRELMRIPHAPKEVGGRELGVHAQIVAAEALAQHGEPDDFGAALKTLVTLADPKEKSVYLRLAALNSLDRLYERVRPAYGVVKSWFLDVPSKDDRAAAGIPRLIHKIIKQLES